MSPEYDDQASATRHSEFILERARAGDASVLSQLRKLLDSDPQLCRECGEPSNRVREKLIIKLSGKDLAISESLKRQLASLKTSLMLPDSTELERLLIEAVLNDWLSLQLATLAHIRGFDDDDDDAPKRTNALERRLRDAHRRFLFTVGALSKLRKSSVEHSRTTNAEPAGPAVASVVDPRSSVAELCADTFHVLTTEECQERSGERLQVPPNEA